MKRFNELGDPAYIYQSELDKAYFQLDMAYGELKDLNKRTAVNRVLCDKAFNIAKNPKYDGYQLGHVSLVYKCFDKKTSGGTVNIERYF